MKEAGVTIAPAIMVSEWEELLEAISFVGSFSKHAQIDVMDGHLVPSFSFPYNKTMLDGRRIENPHNIFLEVHLMVQHPQEVGRRFIHAGASRIVAQVEGFREGELLRVYESWSEEDCALGISILLDTPLADIDELVRSGLVDVIQVMSIQKIGFQGEPFDERAYARIRELKALYPHMKVSVDGGVSVDNITHLIHAGADILSIGSAIMKSSNPASAYNAFTNQRT